MISHTIANTGQFMSHLLIKETLHEFLIREASITTFCQLHLDGTIRPDFYDKDEYEEAGSPEYTTWDKLQIQCREFVKGKKLPLKMQFIFHAPKKLTEEIFAKSAPTFTLNDVDNLTFTIKYENGKTVLTSGLSLKIFTMDKSLERAWDKYVSDFFAPFQ